MNPNEAGFPMANAQRHKRRIKLIKPLFQLKLVGVFVGLSGLGFLLQSLHVGLRLSELASNMPAGATYVMGMLPELPLQILAASFGMLLPLTICVGILVTHKIAGPIYRFEVYLKAVRDGTETAPCRLRKGDELQELCEIISEVTAPLRAQNAAEAERSETAGEERLAA